MKQPKVQPDKYKWWPIEIAEEVRPGGVVRSPWMPKICDQVEFYLCVRLGYSNFHDATGFGPEPVLGEVLIHGVTDTGSICIARGLDTNPRIRTGVALPPGDRWQLSVGNATNQIIFTENNKFRPLGEVSDIEIMSRTFKHELKEKGRKV